MCENRIKNFFSIFLFLFQFSLGFCSRFKKNWKPKFNIEYVQLETIIPAMMTLYPAYIIQSRSCTVFSLLIITIFTSRQHGDDEVAVWDAHTWPSLANQHFLCCKRHIHIYHYINSFWCDVIAFSTCFRVNILFVTRSLTIRKMISPFLCFALHDVSL